MEQVLDLLGFQPSKRSGVQWYGSCPLHASPSGHRRSFSVNRVPGLGCYYRHGCRSHGNQLESGRLPQSCCCSRQSSIFVVGAAATFPGSGVGDGIRARRASPLRATSSPDRTEQGLHRPGAHARRWTYIMPTKEKRPPVLGELASDRGDSIDYRDPHSVNYFDRSQRIVFPFATRCHFALRTSMICDAVSACPIKL